ncbi:hypothetical protein NL676_030856 [Syzygium grande]|nr:hypothetical protein NL676_030856 [Syzygium grande]
MRASLCVHIKPSEPFPARELGGRFLGRTYVRPIVKKCDNDNRISKIGKREEQRSIAPREVPALALSTGEEPAMQTAAGGRSRSPKQGRGFACFGFNEDQSVDRDVIRHSSSFGSRLGLNSRSNPH